MDLYGLGFYILLPSPCRLRSSCGCVRTRCHTYYNTSYTYKYLARNTCSPVGARSLYNNNNNMYADYVKCYLFIFIFFLRLRTLGRPVNRFLLDNNKRIMNICMIIIRWRAYLYTFVPYTGRRRLSPSVARRL